jgi:hypothetical protein
MGADESFESLEHLINTSKLIKWALLRIYRKFNRLAYLAV